MIEGCGSDCVFTLSVADGGQLLLRQRYVARQTCVRGVSKDLKYDTALEVATALEFAEKTSCRQINDINVKTIT